MATVEIIRHKVSGQAAGGGAAPIADGPIIGQKIVTLTGTSQKLTDVDASLVAASNETWTIIVAGGPARVFFGPASGSPVASSILGWPLVDGASIPFSVPAGYTAAVING